MKQLFTLLCLGLTFVMSAQSPDFYNLDENGKWLKPLERYSAAQFHESYHEILQLGSENTLHQVYKKQDEYGMTHTKFQQYHQNTPVEGAIVILHEKNGLVSSINGNWLKDLELTTSATITKETAIQNALKAFPADQYYWEIPAMEALLKKQTKNPDTSFYPSPELVIASSLYDHHSGNYKLCYKMEVFAQNKHNHKTIFIDALTGQLFFELDGCHEGAAQGTAETRYSGTQTITTDSIAPNQFRLFDETRGDGIHVLNANNTNNFGNAIEFLDSNNLWDNTNAQMNDAAGDAFWGLEMTYDYFSQKHGRDSYDDSSGAILAYVHVNSNWFNASWNGIFIQFGDGNSNPLTSIDVSSHELTHGVTQYTADLIYSYESGALNESFSDIFGNAVEFFGEPTTADWLIGRSNFTLRNMADPNSYGHPDTYKGNLWEFGSFDNGGVHINSGVQNYWFYLLSEGGSGTNDNGDNYSVTQLGLDTAGKIAYRNLAYYLVPGSNFFDARLGAILSAEDMYGSCSNAVDQVIKAWHAVGVGPSSYTDDFQMLSAADLNSGCQLSAAEILSCEIRFNPSGCSAQTMPGDTLYFNYDLNGSTVSEAVILTNTPQFGDTLNHTFSTTADFSQNGLYNLSYWITSKHDGIKVNDTLHSEVIKNVSPLDAVNNTLDFENLAFYDGHSYLVLGDQGRATRRPGSASNNSLFGMHLTSLFVNPDNITIPSDPSDNFILNPHYGASICMCVDATNWNNVALTFDAKQTYSEFYKTFPGLNQDIPEYASSLRITINGNQEGVQLHPATYKSDPFYTHVLNLDAYAGTTFTACFEGRHFISFGQDPAPGGVGDNSYIDNIIFEDKSVISIKEESLPALKMFPNPANDLLHIQTKNIAGNVSIVNSLGQVVLNGKISLEEPNIDFELNSLNAGVYFVQIEQNGKMITQKLVVL